MEPRDETDNEDDDEEEVEGGEGGRDDEKQVEGAQQALVVGTNPAANESTVSAQTYQNYKSAMKWFHEHRRDAWGKIGYPWPAEVDLALRKATATYKRDIGKSLLIRCFCLVFGVLGVEL